MPVILQMILSLLAGTMASAGAKRFLAPAAGKAIGRLIPGLAGRKVGLGKMSTTLGKVGTGTAGLGGFFGGMMGFDAATGAALHTTAGEPPQDDTMDTVLAGMNQGMPFQTDQTAGLRRAFDETELINVLEAMGVDINEFRELAVPTRGLI
jgi:hypothetical protein